VCFTKAKQSVREGTFEGGIIFVVCDLLGIVFVLAGNPVCSELESGEEFQGNCICFDWKPFL